VDATKSALTPRHFLNQTSGIRMAWASDLAEVATTDSVQAVLDRPFEAVPGTTFIYAQTAVSVLAAAVEGVAGRDFQDFVRTELFRPVGIGDDEWRWARDPAGNTTGFAGLDMTPRAFARLGTLAERGGDWGGRRTELARNGYFFDVYTTSAYQDLMSGGLDPGDWFVQNTQMSLNIDTGRAGWWDGGLIHFTTQARYGANPEQTFNSGATVPTYTGLLLPDPLASSTMLPSEYFLVQGLSEHTSFIAGKISDIFIPDQTLFGKLKPKRADLVKPKSAETPPNGAPVEPVK
jgi:hypothetical protein